MLLYNYNKIFLLIKKGISGMESLIGKKSRRNIWYPKAVEDYRKSITIDLSYGDRELLLSNFSYSMQYLEYIEKQLRELTLSSVLIVMLNKSYIVTAMGVVELIFVYILKKSGKWNRSVWEEKEVIKSNSKKIRDIETLVETHIYEKVDEYDLRMDLDSMIKRIEKKNLLSIEHNTFPVLKKLRELRNRVHLQLGKDQKDHDYKNFTLENLELMRTILHLILTCDEICTDKEFYSYLTNKIILH